MLKNLDPALGADVLHALRSMGHGDTLVIADTIFHPMRLPGRPGWGGCCISTMSARPGR